MRKQELAVGDSTDLEIIFSTTRRKGLNTKRPVITTNEGPPNRRVTIRANVIVDPDSTYPVVVKPHRIPVPTGEIDVNNGEFTLTNVSDQDLNTSVVSIASEYFTVEIPETIPSGETVTCSLFVNDEYPTNGSSNLFEKSFTIEFDDPAMSRFTVPVYRSLIGAPGRSGSTQKASAGH